MKTLRPRSTEPGAALPYTRVRVVLPPPLCVAGPRSTNWKPATPCCGARSATTLRSGGEPYLRFFACGVDLSLDAPDAPLPEAVPAGREPFPGAGGDGWGVKGTQMASFNQVRARLRFRTRQPARLLHVRRRRRPARRAA